jgi:hypothetical protein
VQIPLGFAVNGQRGRGVLGLPVTFSRTACSELHTCYQIFGDMERSLRLTSYIETGADDEQMHEHKGKETRQGSQT